MTTGPMHDAPAGNDAQQRFESLAARAQHEQAPPVDVRPGVMAAIAAQSAGHADRVARRTLIVCAFSSLAAASVVATLAAGWWIDLGDPLLDLMRAVSVVMQ